MSANVERALLLLEQARCDLAERELRQALASNPDDATAHTLLALCLSRTERHTEATTEAEEAVRLAPDLAFAHYGLASVRHERERLHEAEEAAREALRLDPEEADYYALLAAIQYDRRRWRETLASAEQGLALDAEHVRCNNLRAMALVKLGRKSEAGATIEATLARDPENAITHANQGWALLHRAKHAEALGHFREALRLDPELAWARAGIVEALKAKHFVYGIMLRYFLWMSRLSRGAQWAVLIGGFMGYRVLRDVARDNPAFAPWISPLLVLYFVFALLTYLADPLFNLALRLNRFGRYALTSEQVRASNWVGGCLLLALLAFGAWLATAAQTALMGALVFGALTLPVAATFQLAAGWPRNAMAGYTTLLGVAGVTGVALSTGDLGSVLVGLALLGSLLSGWPANLLAMARPKR